MEKRLQSSLEQADQLVFLCSGNIIRSAFAHLYAENLGFTKDILSAGTKFWNNSIFDKSGNKLIELGVSEEKVKSFKPTHMSELEHHDNAVFFGMKEEHLNALDDYKIPYSNRFLLSEIIGKKTEIKDPYFEGGFEEVFKMIIQCIDALHAAVN